ncbi:MAG TPA: hypothetical protein VHP37_03005 [Burkholderiales bacterium]|nr:hypothetical protein [Burkholderiales bacterium]
MKRLRIALLYAALAGPTSVHGASPGIGAAAAGAVNVADFGGVCDNVTDIGPPMQRAVDALVSVAGGRGGYVDLPAGHCRIETQVRVGSNNIRFRGKGMLATALVTRSQTLTPIRVISVTGFGMSDIGMTGSGPGNKAVGLDLINVWESGLDRVAINRFAVNVRFSPGINASYSNWISDSFITMANATNIDAQAGTNSLKLRNVAIGGSPAQRGVKVVDSTDFNAIGYNCEGVSVACIDIDATRDTVNNSTHHIANGHHENNTSSVADIVVGATRTVYGVRVENIFFSAGAGAQYPIKLVNAHNVTLENNIVASGYAISQYPYIGNVSNLSAQANRWQLPSFNTVLGADVRIGGADLSAPPASNLEVQGGSGITVARDANGTGSGIGLTFRQKDARNTWVPYGSLRGSLRSAVPGAVTAELTLKGKVRGVDTDYLTLDDTGFRPLAKTFANLGAASNGTFVYCPDCAIANPCAGNGTGAFAKRLNGAWICN